MKAWVSVLQLCYGDCSKNPPSWMWHFIKPKRTRGPPLTLKTCQLFFLFYGLNYHSKMKHSIKSPAIPKNTVSDSGEKVLITFFFLVFNRKSVTRSEYFCMKRTKTSQTNWRGSGWKKERNSKEIEANRSRFVSSASRVRGYLYVAEITSGSESETPICLDTLSCDLIGLRNSARLMDEPSACPCTPRCRTGFSYRRGACDLGGVHHTVTYWQDHEQVSLTSVQKTLRNQIISHSDKVPVNIKLKLEVTVSDSHLLTRQYSKQKVRSKSHTYALNN